MPGGTAAAGPRRTRPTITVTSEGPVARTTGAGDERPRVGPGGARRTVTVITRGRTPGTGTPDQETGSHP